MSEMELADRVSKLEDYSEKRIAELEDTVRQQKQVIDCLQKNNTRLLEERRAVDERYMVEHFHRVCDVPVLREPQVPSEERVRLRLRLIGEEFFELMVSVLGNEGLVADAADALGVAIKQYTPKVDLPEFADACADLKYVIVGAELEFGIDGRPIFLGVHEANMKKQGGPVRADGKRLKGPDWKPFNVADALRNQGWREK